MTQEKVRPQSVFQRQIHWVIESLDEIIAVANSDVDVSIKCSMIEARLQNRYLSDRMKDIGFTRGGKEIIGNTEDYSDAGKVLYWKENMQRVRDLLTEILRQMNA